MHAYEPKQKNADSSFSAQPSRHQRSSDRQLDAGDRDQSLAAAAAGHSFSFANVALHSSFQNDGLGPSVENPDATPKPMPVLPGKDAQELSGAPKVDQLNVITSKAGAFSGFPTAKGIDLNVPGPFNNTTTTGSCVNVHQMQFHLAKGDPEEVKLIRKVINVTKANGRTGTKGKKGTDGAKDEFADDGPSAGSVIRPANSSSIVVADAPGFIGTGDATKIATVFPISYEADFELFALDPIAPKLLAELKYSVSIAKQSFSDSAPTNQITEKSRKLY